MALQPPVGIASAGRPGGLLHIATSHTLLRRFPRYSSKRVSAVASPEKQQDSPKEHTKRGKQHTARNKNSEATREGGGSRRRSPRRQDADPAASQERKQRPFANWRVFNVNVSLDDDPGKDDYTIHEALMRSLELKLGCQTQLDAAAMSLVRKTYDARRSKRCFSYVVDVSPAAVKAAGAKRLKIRPGELERVSPESTTGGGQVAGKQRTRSASLPRDPVIIVGSGPAGLFAALELAEAGAPVLLLERGQPVEVRGRDIGALMVRRRLNPDSNVCYGEGGAGTWSDGKLTTRIGRNSDPVRRVLRTLHGLGAPESVLVDGKPHIGTDRLVRILRAFRAHLTSLGAEICFSAHVEGLTFGPGGRVSGVQLRGGQRLAASAVVLAVGHSARSMYVHLADAGVALAAKPFAVGFRIEHPQALLDGIQYGARDAAEVQRGRGKIPVADYSLAYQVQGGELASRLHSSTWTQGERHWMGGGGDGTGADEAEPRGVFSFCMCPGGQIVPTSTTPDELCINGMSFSRRNSVWANSALVVGVLPSDWAHLEAQHGPLAGVELQRMYEQEAAARGGGGLVAPVQRAPDFLAGVPSPDQGLPSSSYRLGVRSAPLHDLYAPPLSVAIAEALIRFEARLPGFVCDSALLHGAETRTSAPVRVERGGETCESVSTPGLFPAGEGAGYAGGIVSAAVDGLKVGRAVLAALLAEAPA